MPRTKTTPTGKTCSVILPDDLLALLQAEARRLEIPLSYVIRQMLREQEPILRARHPHAAAPHSLPS